MLVMVRNRSRAVTKQSPIMADHQASSLSPPTPQNPTQSISSFLGSPRFFNGGFLPKNLSPTSILDTNKQLINFPGNPFGSSCHWFPSFLGWRWNGTSWEISLSLDYQKIVMDAEDDGCFLSFSSKKQLYLHHCDHPLTIDGAIKLNSIFSVHSTVKYVTDLQVFRGLVRDNSSIESFHHQPNG
ncbi:unnamed protein product [Lactuca saligna]|uniref:Uncharacterized protein n=1 Tax=Lactuca saligna TaxID=75948 RepID=A0AA35YYC9_LACSI|nr:unnamed protein product [Lactuca saligna]